MKDLVIGVLLGVVAVILFFNHQTSENTRQSYQTRTQQLVQERDSLASILGQTPARDTVYITRIKKVIEQARTDSQRIDTLPPDEQVKLFALTTQTPVAELLPDSFAKVPQIAIKRANQLITAGNAAEVKFGLLQEHKLRQDSIISTQGRLIEVSYDLQQETTDELKNVKRQVRQYKVAAGIAILLSIISML
jgi:gas vesicle protein